MEPVHIVIFGLLIVVAGFIWQSVAPRVATHLEIAPDERRMGETLAWRREPGLFWNKLSDGTTYIRTLGFEAVQKGSEQLTLTNAFLRSNLTGAQLPLKVQVPSTGLIEIDKINPVPVGATLSLQTDELNGTTGQKEPDFIREWGAFDLIVEFDGRREKVTFDRASIDAVFSGFRPSPPQPRVTLKRTTQ